MPWKLGQFQPFFGILREKDALKRSGTALQPSVPLFSQSPVLFLLFPASPVDCSLYSRTGTTYYMYWYNATTFSDDHILKVEMNVHRKKGQKQCKGKTENT